jgi:hypothetical protein
MVGWNVCPKQLVAQLILKDKCFKLLCMNYVYENDLYVVVMSY